jgi:hypothetical protein
MLFHSDDEDDVSGQPRADGAMVGDVPRRISAIVPGQGDETVRPDDLGRVGEGGESLEPAHAIVPGQGDETARPDDPKVRPVTALCVTYVSRVYK